MSTNSAAENLLGGHAEKMDKMYRWQRHVYDASRAYYLLGRDQMLDAVAAGPCENVLEIGCGTGRNLAFLGRKAPQAKLYGLDISHEMLQSAGATLHKVGLVSRTKLAQGDATDLDARRSFGRAQFDQVYIAYSLSMIPDWQRALRQAWACVTPGGGLHVVDFGSCERLPRLAKRGLRTWLSWFHVQPRENLESALRDLGGQLEIKRPFRGYAVVACLRKSA